MNQPKVYNFETTSLVRLPIPTIVQIKALAKAQDKTIKEYLTNLIESQLTPGCPTEDHY